MPILPCSDPDACPPRRPVRVWLWTIVVVAIAAIAVSVYAHSA